MPFYHKLGQIPRVKHTAFYKPDGTLYREELVSSKGFSDIYNNKYHIHSSTQQLKINEIFPFENSEWRDYQLKHYHFDTDRKPIKGDFFSSRVSYLENSNCKMYCAYPTENADYFFRNAYASEYIFVHRGRGKFKSDYGVITFEPGDQIIVPQSTTYQMDFDDFEDNKLLIVESSTAYEIPKHYMNQYGQLEEHAPFCERDIKVPEYLETHDEKGEFRVVIKANDRYFEYIHPYHPFDIVGWDGYLYPWAMNIKSYHPKVGRIHLPPPVHLFITTSSFVICNFCPRLFDWHEGSIPAPYFHSNIDSDEVLYYVEGDFMSRKGVKDGSVTLHPMGIPHGPQPGKTEASIGVRDTEEYAVMVDTFEPLKPTIHTKNCEYDDYYKSWLE